MVSKKLHLIVGYVMRDTSITMRHCGLIHSICFSALSQVGTIGSCMGLGVLVASWKCVGDLQQCRLHKFSKCVFATKGNLGQSSHTQDLPSTRCPLHHPSSAFRSHWHACCSRPATQCAKVLARSWLAAPAVVTHRAPAMEGCGDIKRKRERATECDFISGSALFKLERIGQDTSPLCQDNAYSFVIRPRSQGRSSWILRWCKGGRVETKAHGRHFTWRKLHFRHFSHLEGSCSGQEMEVGKQDDGTKHGKKHNKRLNNPGTGRGTSLHHLILCMQPVAPGQRQISPEVRACQDSRPEEQGSSMWLHHGLIPGCDSLLADASLFVTLWPKGVKGAVVLVVAALSACVAFPFICFTFATQQATSPCPIILPLCGKSAIKAEMKFAGSRVKKNKKNAKFSFGFLLFPLWILETHTKESWTKGGATKEGVLRDLIQ